MNYKKMFEAVERKLNAELAMYQRFRGGYEKKELETSFFDSKIESIEEIVKFTEELRRLYA